MNEERRVQKIFVKQTSPLYGEGNVQTSGDEASSNLVLVFPTGIGIEVRPLCSRRGLAFHAQDGRAKEYLKHTLKIAVEELEALDDKKDYFLKAGEFNEIEEES